MMPILIRRTSFGRRAERIDNSALQPMLAAGLVRKVQQGVDMYEELSHKEPLVQLSDEVANQTYETKVMVAAEPKARGRSPKAKA